MIDYYAFGDGDGSGPTLELDSVGPIRPLEIHPIERMRRTYGDGSGFISTTYHAPLCEDLNCQGCGPEVKENTRQ